jgi:4-hydroxy-tetrahydrodipicolinate synthase
MSVEGILPVIPTPFLDGRFDPTSFERLLDHMLGSVDGYVLLGSTGEAPSLTRDERCAIAEFALQRTPADKAVVIGITHTVQAEAVELARHAQAHGAAATLCAAPFYFVNTPAAVLSYLEAIDAALEIELVFYDNPAATKTVLAATDVVEWSNELEHLNAVKLTDHDLNKVVVWQEAGLRVMAGDDPIAFRYLAAGVDGAMLIVPAIFPEAFRACWDAVRDDRLTDAMDVFGPEIAPFTHVFGIGDEIATSKSLLADIGVFDSPEVRAPLIGPTPERQTMLRDAYAVCRAASARHGRDSARA